MKTEALKRACEHAGGQLHLAKRIGVTQSMVWYWLERAKKGVPAEHAIAIERATDGKVTAHELRPDVFPPPANGDARTGAVQ